MTLTRIALLLSALSCPLLASKVPVLHADDLVNRIDPEINLSALVVDLNTGTTLYARNPQRELIPASNMKLFSDAAALLALGPDHQFSTQLSTDATKIHAGVLHGTLYLHLHGDPSFNTHDLDVLFNALTSLGIQRIDGNIVLASDNQATDAYAPGWMHTDLAYSYGAPLAPLILDENRVLVTVNPGSGVNTPAWIETSASQLIIQNQVKTTLKPKHCGLNFHMDSNNRLTVNGCIGVGQAAVMQRLAIQNPFLYAQHTIQSRLERLHITLLGKILLKKAPEHTLLLATHHSKPIAQLMADTLKPSDNLYADSLYLHAARTLEDHANNWDSAQHTITHFLQEQTNIPLQTARLVDGSGLSREDRLSAQQTVDLLRFLHVHFPLAYEYIAALPIAGQDGTLEKRLKKPYQKGLVRAKTGSMTGVTSLSGYLYTANAHTLAFAFYINKRPNTPARVSGQYRGLIDALCDYFLKQKPENCPVITADASHATLAFQQQPTQNQIRRATQTRWRQLESVIKRALKDSAVQVVFRDQQLLLHDRNTTPLLVWQALQTIHLQHPFSVMLKAAHAPSTTSPNDPQLLWMQSDATPNGKRLWIVHGIVD